MGEMEADWGGIGLSPSLPSALRNPQCCVHILEGKFAGTLAPPCQWNGEMESGVSNLSFGSGDLGGGDPRLRPWIKWRWVGYRFFLLFLNCRLFSVSHTGSEIEGGEGC